MSVPFYRGLVALTVHDELESLLQAALLLVSQATASELAYIELQAEHGPRYAGHCEGSNLETIRASISRGIISRALAERCSIDTSSAMSDARFQDLNSVRQHAIAAVLCVPIGGDPAIGVLYLQRAHGAPGFTRSHRERTEDLCVLLDVFLHRLVDRAPAYVPLAEERDALRDRRIRQSLSRHKWNVTEAARELGVSRSLIYRLLPGLRRPKAGV